MTNKEVFDKFFDNSIFEDWRCKDCVRRECLTPCGTCDWWDKEYAGSIKEESKPFKIFISQPMKDRTTEEIMQERNRIATRWKNEVAKWESKSVEIINSYFGEGASKNPTDSLGKSISLMSEADLVVFAPGWESARGCRIEHEVAKEYGLQIAYFI